MINKALIAIKVNNKKTSKSGITINKSFWYVTNDIVLVCLLLTLNTLILSSTTFISDLKHVKICLDTSYIQVVARLH